MQWSSVHLQNRKTYMTVLWCQFLPGKDNKWNGIKNSTRYKCINIQAAWLTELTELTKLTNGSCTWQQSAVPLVMCSHHICFEYEFNRWTVLACCDLCVRPRLLNLMFSKLRGNVNFEHWMCKQTSRVKTMSFFTVKLKDSTRATQWWPQGGFSF